MLTTRVAALENMVALHPEGVDRNSEYETNTTNNLNVALHPEGVDRNKSITKQ